MLLLLVDGSACCLFLVDCTLCLSQFKLLISAFFSHYYTQTRRDARTPTHTHTYARIDSKRRRRLVPIYLFNSNLLLLLLLLLFDCNACQKLKFCIFSLFFLIQNLTVDRQFVLSHAHAALWRRYFDTYCNCNSARNGAAQQQRLPWRVNRTASSAILVRKIFCYKRCRQYKYVDVCAQTASHSTCVLSGVSESHWVSMMTVGGVGWHWLAATSSLVHTS